MIDAGDAEGAEQLVAGAMDARLRIARLAMRRALVGEVRPQVVKLALLALLYVGVAWWAASWRAPGPHHAPEPAG